MIGKCTKCELVYRTGIADLRGADLRGANLEGADLEGADLDRALGVEELDRA